MYCTKCGKELPEGGIFCAYCGEKQTVLAQTNTDCVQSKVNTPVLPPEKPFDKATVRVAPRSSKRGRVILGVVVGAVVLLGAFLAFLYFWPPAINELPPRTLDTPTASSSGNDVIVEDSLLKLDIGDIYKFGGHEWRVLDVQGDKALLLTEGVVELLAYDDYGDHDDDPDNDVYVYAEWADSSIRNWLNNEFYNSLGAADKRQVLETRVINDESMLYEYPLHRIEKGENTTDKVFLLSIDEAVKYLGDSGLLSNLPIDSDGRFATDELGNFVIDDEYTDDRIAIFKIPQEQIRDVAQRIYDDLAPSDATFDRVFEELEPAFSGRTPTPCAWWLRTSSSNGFSHPVFVGGAFGVDVSSGVINLAGDYCGDILGVRPALWLDLKGASPDGKTGRTVASGTGNDATNDANPSPTQIIPTDSIKEDNAVLGDWVGQVQANDLPMSVSLYCRFYPDNRVVLIFDYDQYGPSSMIGELRYSVDENKQITLLSEDGEEAPHGMVLIDSKTVQFSFFEADTELTILLSKTVLEDVSSITGTWVRYRDMFTNTGFAGRAQEKYQFDGNGNVQVSVEDSQYSGSESFKYSFDAAAKTLTLIDGNDDYPHHYEIIGNYIVLWDDGEISMALRKLN